MIKLCLYNGIQASSGNCNCRCAQGRICLNAGMQLLCKIIYTTFRAVLVS